MQISSLTAAMTENSRCPKRLTKKLLLLKNVNYPYILTRYSDIFVRFVKSMFNNQNSDIKYP